MNGRISLNRIIDATLSGIEVAFNNHYEISGGWWLDNAPEYYITSTLANYFGDLEGAKYVTLEHGVKNAMEIAGAVSRGRYTQKIRRNGRSDLLLWWGGETPRALIEIKSPLNSLEKKAVSDLERIASVLLVNKRNHTLKFGLFCFYSSATNGIRKSSCDILKDRFDSMLKKAEGVVGSCKIISKESRIIHEREHENGSWMAACFAISA